MKLLPLNWRVLLATLALTGALFAIGLQRLEVDTDILGTLPQTDPVIADATYLLRNHPMQNQVVIDVSLKNPDLETLIACGLLVESRLKQSGLFKSVGLEDFQALMPDLLAYITANLPVLFSAAELQDRVGPLLDPSQIRQRLAEVHASLLGLEGIGQAHLIANDPLNLRGLVLGRLSHLMPAAGARVYRGQLVSADGRHLLLVANPAGSGTATELAAQLAEQINRAAAEADQAYGGAGQRVTLTPVGAYRAALDNQTIIKRDIGFAIGLSTAGIAALLFFSFCRPLIGLFSLLPAVTGTMLAYFIFSLFHESISILVLGFGGAIISFSVDQGLAYLLFLDRPFGTQGREASEQVRGMGLLAVLTTVAAFGTLCFSGFPVFVQLGQFTMLGLGLCFLIVHLVFPRIFPTLPPGGARALHLQRPVDALAGTGRAGLWAAAVFAAGMLFFAKPVFNVSLQAMNTVGTETQAAEKLLTDVWGGIFDKVYLLAEGRTLPELQNAGDILLEKIDADVAAGILSSGFASSRISPGATLREKNFSAWRRFWTAETVAALQRAIAECSAPLGFAADAFAGFYDLLVAPNPPPENDRLIERYQGILGVSTNPDGSQWIQVSTVTTGPAYDAGRFHQQYRSTARLFDPQHFSASLGDLLFESALLFFYINVACSFLLVALFTVDLALTLACMLPLAFAFIGTLGTLNLMGRPLDIPGLMLSIIVFGVGIDYAVFYVRSYQRYGTLGHPAFSQIRMAVFLSAATTLMGFGAMWFADHSLLRSTGITAFLGIGYCMLGAFLILPPALGWIHRRRQTPGPTGGTRRERVLSRYRWMEVYPRFFARFKLQLDPMFAEMERIFQSLDGIKTILDIGTGYGVPASWMLERFPNARLCGLEPAAERVRVAAMALGNRGTISQGQAPALPPTSEPIDLATLIDMVHFLNDDELRATLGRLHTRLRRGATLAVRASVPPTRRLPWSWWYQNARLRFSGIPVYYRPAQQLQPLIVQAGFSVERTLPSGSQGELIWLIAVRP